MNFGELKSRLLAQIGRAPSDMCYELVTADVNNGLRVPEMLTSVALTEALTITLPTDFRAVDAIWVNKDVPYPLKPSTENAMKTYGSTQGLPRFYVIKDGEMLLDRVSGGSETIELTYYANLADLAADTDFNDVLTKYPAIYIYGTLAHHSALTKDREAASGYFTLFNNAIDDANSAARRSRMSGSPMQVRATVA